MPITFKRAGQEAVTLENVSFKGVALDKVTFKRHGQEAVTVFENVTEDALAGTWVFNDTIDYTSFMSVTGATSIEFNFTSNGNTYFGITTDFKPNGLKYIITPGTSNLESVYAASTNTWTNEAYKTITITSKLSEVANGEQLLTWLQANATKQ